MSKKKSFIMYSDRYPLIAHLRDEQLGQLLRALYLFVLDEPLNKLDPEVMIVFNFFKQSIVENNSKYEEICEKRREAGRLGGRPRKNQMLLEKPNAFFEKQMKANKTLTDTDTDTDTDVFFTENNKEKDKKESEIIIPEVVSVSTPYAELSEAWGKWKDYKSARRERYSCSAAEESAYRQLYSLSKGDAQLAMQIVEQSIANDWKGLYELKQNDNANTKTNRSSYKTATERLRDDYASIFASVLTNTAGGSKVS